MFVNLVHVYLYKSNIVPRSPSQQMWQDLKPRCLHTLFCCTVPVPDNFGFAFRPVQSLL